MIDDLPRDVTLRDGRPARLRRVTLDDAEGLWRLQRALVADGRGVVLLPADLPGDPGPKRADLETWVGHPQHLKLVAEVGGRMMGSIDVRRIDRTMMRHNGTLSMGVHPTCQGAGLGRLLVEEAMAWAQEAGLIRVELSTLAANVRAQNLYRSSGFVERYRRRGFLRRPDGRLEDDVVMVWRAPG